MPSGADGDQTVYGTSNVLCGLAYFIGNDLRIPDMVNAATQWLKSVQNTDGGWGETLETYKKPELAGCGITTPSQTAWALMAFLAYLPPTDTAIKRGTALLVMSQNNGQKAGASWHESYYTGSGFPHSFYVGYSYYRHYFPMMALGRYLQATKAPSTSEF